MPRLRPGRKVTLMIVSMILIRVFSLTRKVITTPPSMLIMMYMIPLSFYCLIGNARTLPLMMTTLTWETRSGCFIGMCSYRNTTSV
ncbi:hypothetical protein F5883DRAFT_595204, partial [Diaporthe sp. PMI_573]